MLDIEDIKKSNLIDNEIWKNIINDFLNTYINFENRNDVILFQKKIQKNYKITLSNCDLIKIYNELNIDKGQVISKANAEDIEKEYLANTESARNNKVFGSPSFIVNGEIFWGDDRMEDAITWSKKNG